MNTRYFHGGTPGLKPGHLILPPATTGTARTLAEYSEQLGAEHVRETTRELLAPRPEQRPQAAPASGAAAPTSTCPSTSSSTAASRSSATSATAPCTTTPTGVWLCQRIFGVTLDVPKQRSTVQVPVRLIAEQHVLEDLGWLPSPGGLHRRHADRPVDVRLPAQDRPALPPAPQPAHRRHPVTTNFLGIPVKGDITRATPASSRSRSRSCSRSSRPSSTTRRSSSSDGASTPRTSTTASPAPSAPRHLGPHRLPTRTSTRTSWRCGATAASAKKGGEWVPTRRTPNGTRGSAPSTRARTKARYDRCRELRPLEGGAFENVLLDAFGDHANITVRRDGIQVEFYDHD
jgi:hypothetical protein